MNNEPNVKSARPHVFRMPLMILLGLVVGLVLLVRVGLPMWAAREERISAIPKSGTFVCDDLAVSISFGKGTLLTLPDSTSTEVAIDYGRRITELSEDSSKITGWYEAHLEDGYIEIRFTELPIPFDPEYSYRFEME